MFTRIIWILSFLELTRLALSSEADGHLVIRILPRTKEQLDYLVALERNAIFLKLDFWKSPKAIDLPVDLMIEQGARSTLLKEMRSKGISFSPMINSVEECVLKFNFELINDL